MKQFKVGTTYSTRSACDYDCIFTYKVTARTAKTITIEKWDGTTERRGVRPSYCGQYETCLPEGRYSMAPCITAE